MARPSKLTDEMRGRIAQLLVAGCSIEVAASAAGVHPRTLERWLARAQQLHDRDEAGKRIDARDRIYLQLLDEVRSAQAQAEVKMLATIQQAALAGTWQAAAWFLERTIPERYGGARRKPGRPLGASSAPDRPGTQPAPPRLRLRAVK